MSAIEATNPLGTETTGLGASRMREYRVWLADAWLAYVNRNQDGSVPNDPGTSNGFFKVQAAAPVFPLTPEVGDFFISSDGLLQGYKTGPVLQLMGDFENANTLAVFSMAATPTGWTRDTSLTTNSFLRYLASGAVGSGGTDDAGVAITHAITIDASFVNFIPPFNLITAVPAHSVYAFTDILLAKK